MLKTEISKKTEKRKLVIVNEETDFVDVQYRDCKVVHIEGLENTLYIARFWSDAGHCYEWGVFEKYGLLVCHYVGLESLEFSLKKVIAYTLTDSELESRVGEFIRENKLEKVVGYDVGY